VLGSSPQADTVWYRKILEYRVDRESRSGTAARWPNQAQMYSCCAWSGSAKRKSFTFDTRKLFRCEIAHQPFETIADRFHTRLVIYSKGLSLHPARRYAIASA
jgi:hypothetical protein